MLYFLSRSLFYTRSPERGHAQPRRARCAADIPPSFELWSPPLEDVLGLHAAAAAARGGCGQIHNLGGWLRGGPRMLSDGVVTGCVARRTASVAASCVASCVAGCAASVAASAVGQLVGFGAGLLGKWQRPSFHLSSFLIRAVSEGCKYTRPGYSSRADQPSFVLPRVGV